MIVTVKNSIPLRVFKVCNKIIKTKIVEFSFQLKTHL